MGLAVALVGLGNVEEIGDVAPAALEHGPACGALGHALEDQPLYRGDLSPEALVGFHHQLDSRSVADELVGPEADRRALEAVVAHPLDVLPGDDPARAGHDAPVV